MAFSWLKDTSGNPQRTAWLADPALHDEIGRAFGAQVRAARLRHFWSSGVVGTMRRRIGACSGAAQGAVPPGGRNEGERDG